jgi:hypothetical protein
MSRSTLALVLVSLAGCAHKGVALRPAAVVVRPAPPPEATGVWEWVFRSTDEQGDVRVEQEEWHLEQRGQEVKGYYDRAVTMMSTDERLFRCNQQLGFTKLTRVQVAGVMRGDKMLLHEVGFEAKPGPCDDGARNLVAYVGVVGSGTIHLQWAPNAGQTLHRREGVPARDTGVEWPGEGAQASGVASFPVDGTWVWELKSIDAEGDERVEREEWHLSETPDGIHGDYVRRVMRVRGDGVFSCSSSDRYETVTRYTIAGQRQGDRVTLTETRYELPEGAGARPCDNGMRRLDTYQGTVQGEGEELVLSWGPGNQLLRRQR